VTAAEPSPRPSPALEEARRRRVGVRGAAEDVERALASASSGRPEQWAAEVSARAAKLDDAWTGHIAATEAPDGLFAQVMADAPRLAHRIEQLQADHVAIREGIEALRTRTGTSGADLDELRELAFDLLGRISRHRHLGADLVYEAYTVDIARRDGIGVRAPVRRPT
jgi:hypothetical protein